MSNTTDWSFKAYRLLLLLFLPHLKPFYVVLVRKIGSRQLFNHSAYFLGLDTVSLSYLHS